MKGATLRDVSRASNFSPELKLTGEQIAAIARVVAEPRRFAILQQIASHQELACSGLAAHGCISPATISHHLKELQAVGLVRAEREGRGMRLSFQRPLWEAYLRELAAL